MLVNQQKYTLTWTISELGKEKTGFEPFLAGSKESAREIANHLAATLQKTEHSNFCLVHPDNTCEPVVVSAPVSMTNLGLLMYSRPT